jgi:hypothetical protein
MALPGIDHRCGPDKGLGNWHHTPFDHRELSTTLRGRGLGLCRQASAVCAP